MAGIPIKQVQKALIDSCGIVSQAAKNLGIERSGLTKRIKNHKILQQTLEEAREVFLDKGESALKTAVENGEHWAVSLLLKTLGKHRGYVEKQELGVDGNITVKVVKFSDENPGS